MKDVDVSIFPLKAFPIFFFYSILMFFSCWADTRAEVVALGKCHTMNNAIRWAEKLEITHRPLGSSSSSLCFTEPSQVPATLNLIHTGRSIVGVSVAL